MRRCSPGPSASAARHSGTRGPAGLQELVEAADEGCFKTFDVNPRPAFIGFDVIEQSLPLANALKLNDPEREIVARRQGLPGEA